MAHVLIVEARFYSHLNDMLLDGVRSALEADGHSHETVTVPGALEVPAAISLAADSENMPAQIAATPNISPTPGVSANSSAPAAVATSGAVPRAIGKATEKSLSVYDRVSTSE